MGVDPATTQLKGSVGLGGVNLRDDVMTVQALLKSVGVDPGRIEGHCGPRTVASIQAFQKRFLPHGDGRVDPNVFTWKKLTGAPGRPPAAVQSEWSGDSSQWIQEKKLRSLDPLLRPKVQAVLVALRNQGFQPKIFFGWRSVAVQHDLYLKGRTKVQFSFHNAQKPDGTPNAYAADIVDVRWGWEKPAEEHGFWTALGKAAKDVGLVWGGDWKSFPDVAHVQSRQNSELAAVKKASGL